MCYYSTMSKKVITVPKNPLSKLSAFSQLSPREQRFVAALSTGMPKYRAYQFSDPTKNMAPNSAAAVATEKLKQPKIKAAIVEAMQAAGCNEVTVAAKIARLLDGDLHKDATRAIDRGLVHARAILGLDAPKESHMVVDKRDIRITAAASLNELEYLISKTRPETVAPQSKAPNQTTTPNHEESTTEPKDLVVIDLKQSSNP